MNDTAIIQIALQAMIVTAKLAMPILVVTLAIGVGVSVVQSVTQVQEFTLTFVPKMLGVGVVLLVGGNWMLNEMVNFTRTLFIDTLPQLL
ncbi:MAG TPA: flagellar biosynthetic protein FliQ [Acidimicrobiales bacterium]|nr:flagellar biosynthetic protein FliQ [Acidimicrobiales bacterium]